MGGESTLLPNLTEYIKIGSLHSRQTRQTRLTTNGKLLNKQSMLEYKAAGLDGINISIAAFNVNMYKTIHGTDCDLTTLLYTIYNNRDKIDFRINIPLCKENCDNNFSELKYILKVLTDENFNITICEDVKGKFSLYDQFEIIGAKVVEETAYGLIFIEYNGHKIGYYTHKNNYNDTDIVVTSVGTFINWDGYCETVGINNEKQTVISIKL